MMILILDVVGVDLERDKRKLGEGFFILLHFFK